MSKQPNFSIDQQQLIEKFPQLRESESKMFVAAIGTPFMASNGEEQIPVLLVQKTTRLRGNTQEFAEISRGWGGRILRRVENFTTAQLRALKIKEGYVFDNAFISVKRTLKPQFEVHKPMLNPRTDEVITHKGMPIYEQTFISMNSPKDEGLELTYDVPVEVGEEVRS